MSEVGVVRGSELLFTDELHVNCSQMGGSDEPQQIHLYIFCGQTTNQFSLVHVSDVFIYRVRN